jgi:hypothetical protein
MDEIGPESAGQNPGINTVVLAKNQDRNISTPGFNKTGGYGSSSHDFWKASSSGKDIADLGYDTKNYKKNQVVPVTLKGSDDKSENGSFARAGTANDRYIYEKEKERDPAIKMAAMHHRKINSLRNEEKDQPFSYFCSSAEVIIDKSNSHPSFRIYYSFVKRYMIVAFILAMLANCLIAYNGTSDWYDSKDIKWGTEYINLGNIDGVAYHIEGTYATSVGQDNADKGIQFTV